MFGYVLLKTRDQWPKKITYLSIFKEDAIRHNSLVIWSVKYFKAI